jgi:hypothetical protein
MSAEHVDRSESLIEAAATAFREREVTGRIKPSSAWQDLSPEERRVLFERQLTNRIVDRAVDPDDRSSTVRAVLARLTFLPQFDRGE